MTYIDRCCLATNLYVPEQQENKETTQIAKFHLSLLRQTSTKSGNLPKQSLIYLLNNILDAIDYQSLISKIRIKHADQFV